MNGRVYDYNLGRFTGVDPVIQFPLNSQSLNPYSYILNNPLSGTDPTGYVASCEPGNRRQVCQLGVNTLDALQAEIQGMVAGMGAGADSGRVTAMREASNGAAMGGVDDAMQTVNSGTYKIGTSSDRGNLPDVTASDKNRSLLQTLDPNSLPGLDRAKETKLYIGGGSLLAYSQSNCAGDDRCRYSDKDIVGRTTLDQVEVLAHVHAVVAARIQSTRLEGANVKINNLSRNSPGPGDDAPLSIGRASGVITPDGYRYLIERRSNQVRAGYLGGGSDPAFGKYVEKYWRPGIDVRNMAEDYYYETFKSRGSH